MYSQTAVCRAFLIHSAQILPKPAHFGYISAICCHRGGVFPSEASFAIHQAKIMSRMSAWECFKRIFCHRRHEENASLRYPATADMRRTHHGEITPSPTSGERIMVKSCPCRNVENSPWWNPAPAGHFGACLGEITQKPCPPEAVASTGASELRSTMASSRPRIKLPTRRPFSSRLRYPRVFCYTRLREAFISTLQRVNRTRTVVLIASLLFFIFDGTIRNEKKFEVAHSRTA